MVLTVSRMLILVYPFRRSNKRAILTSVAAYTLLQVLLSTIPYWRALRFYYEPRAASCTYDMLALFQVPYTSPMAYPDTLIAWYFYRSVGEFLVPLLTIVPCCVVSICVLQRTPASRPNPTPQRCNKYSASLTIVLLGVVYIVCNIPLLVYTILTLIDLTTDYQTYRFFSSDHPNNYYYIVVCLVTVLVNSAVNPVLFCTRVGAIQVWLRRVVGRLVRKRREGTDPRPQFQLVFLNSPLSIDVINSQCNEGAPTCNVTSANLNVTSSTLNVTSSNCNVTVNIGPGSLDIRRMTEISSC